MMMMVMCVVCGWCCCWGEGGRCRGVLGEEREVCYCNAKNATRSYCNCCSAPTTAGRKCFKPGVLHVAKTKNATTRNCMQQRALRDSCRTHHFRQMNRHLCKYVHCWRATSADANYFWSLRKGTVLQHAESSSLTSSPFMASGRR